MAVRDYLSSHTGLKASSIKDSYELKKPPLRLDDNNLAYLAMSLRGYIKRYQKGNTIRVKELRKSKLTAGKLWELVYTRVK